MRKIVLFLLLFFIAFPVKAFDETVKEAQALNGDVSAALQLGRYYYLEKKQPQNAEKWLKIAADNHNAEALYYLAKIYDDSHEGKHSNKQILTLLEEAGGKGWTDAQVMLGRIYQFGRKGILKDVNKARMWYDLAAAKGSQEALKQLDLIYHSSKDGYVKAQQKDDDVAWLTKAVEQGNPEAAYRLGVLFEQGKKVPKNEKKASELYQKASDAGVIQAQTALGAMYADGRGVKRNDEKAIPLLKSAAEKGYVEAQRKLADIYAYKLRHFPNAYAWQVISLSAMFPNADNLTDFSPELERLLRTMTPEQVKEGQKTAARLVEIIKKNKSLMQKKQEKKLDLMRMYQKSIKQ